MFYVHAYFAITNFVIVLDVQFRNLVISNV